MTLRLIDHAEPLEDIDFPNGSNHFPAEWSAAEYQEHRALTEAPDGVRALALLRRTVPTATDEDIASLSPRMWQLIFAAAQRKIDLVLTALKNAEAGMARAASHTRPSSPKMPKATSAPASPAPSVKTGGTSPVSPTTQRSLRSTISKKRSGLTRSSGNPVPSLTPSG